VARYYNKADGRRKMRHQVRRATALCILLAFSSAPAAQAARSCDTRYFLPIAPGARWTFAREAQPRTVENIQTDSFEVHIAHPTEYQGQPDVIDWVDTYHCGADGLSLVQNSEIDEGAQAGLFGGLYQGLGAAQDDRARLRMGIHVRARRRRSTTTSGSR
jgi:hypothetical protein